ncbi:hypothetical protein BT96DRAFT_528765 [Gymnopus androsaceus JB14]|uniref:Uncharacterized protein n=1 Tax=Gymnopus androsaceus JB14 TaxID=1447944 RepID=A0A6A4IK67_9AGAR|nr:hypothetical protein BT96DRAFT_528765 [Gymnopus androsaceus JB14]
MVTDYFHTKLGQELDHESHITSIQDYADAPFKVYVIRTESRRSRPRSPNELSSGSEPGRTDGEDVLVEDDDEKCKPCNLSRASSLQAVSIQSSLNLVDLTHLFRVCRVEIYRVRLVLYHTIQQWAIKGGEILQKDGKATRESNSFSREFADALKIFDDVLRHECVEDHASLPTLSASEIDPLYCDYCGADIFQSFFECDECTFSRAQDRDPCTVCPGCFAEGRSCHCRAMKPKQIQPLTKILEDRAKAIGVLQRLWKLNSDKSIARRSFASERSLFAGGAFKAGCILAKSRKEKGPSTCSIPGQPHHLSRGDVVHCKPCHRSTCYFHLLKDSKMHSINIILDTSRSDKDSSHHKRHLANKHTYETDLHRCLEAERKGQRPADSDFEVQMVNLALSFSKCRPINFNMNYGWYDSIIVAPAIIRMPNVTAGSPPPPYVAEEATNDDSSTSVASLADSSSTAGPSNAMRNATASAGVLSSSEPSTSKPSKAKKRKLVMDCVMLRSTSPAVQPSKVNESSSSKQTEIIELSSDSDSNVDQLLSPSPSPPPRTSNATATAPSSSSPISSASIEEIPQRRARVRNVIPPTRGTHFGESYSFTNDLASAINNVSHAAEAANASLVSTPKRVKRKPRGSMQAVAAVAPAEVADDNVASSSKRGRGRPRKETPVQPNTSSSLGKRRKDDSDHHESSSEDDRPFVAEPQMPAKKTQDRVGYRPPSVVALGKKKAPAASVSTARIAVGSSHASSSTTRRNQHEERRIARTGTHSVMGGQEAAGTSMASSSATKAQLSLPSVSRKRRERSPSDRVDPILESSRSETDCTDERVSRRRMRSVSQERDERRKRSSRSNPDRNDEYYKPERDERHQPTFSSTNSANAVPPQDYTTKMRYFPARFRHLLRILALR